MSTETVTYLLKLRDKFSGGMATANQQVTTLDKGSAGAALSIGKVGIALGALGIFAAGKAILQAGMNMEQTRVAFATFLGDADKANRTIAELNQFSNITPFNNDEVIKSGRVLLAAQVPAENLTKTLKNIGDVAAGSQVPLNELTGIYAKVLNKGKVQAEELNQLAERGIPILQVLGEQYGVTSKEILKMGSDGKLTSDNIATAFATMSSEGGIFFNLMEKQSATAAGKLSTLQGGLGLLAAELGEKANPAMGEILDKLINLTNFLKENQETVITVVKVMAQLTAAFVAYKATVIATQKATLLFNAIQKASVITNIFFTKGIKKARVAMRLFNVTAKANPIGLIVSALVLAIPLFVKLASKTKEASTAVKTMNNVNKLASSIIAKETSRLNVLQKTLETGNINQRERGEIIKEINKNYGEYLPKLLTEKSTNEEIATALALVNKELLKKAKLTAINQKIEETSKKQLEIELLRADATRVREKATEGLIKKLALLGASLSFNKGAQQTALIKKEQSELNDEYKKTEDELTVLLALQKIASRGIKSPGGTNKDGGGVILDKDSKKTLETGIKAGAAKQVIINIGSLVENFEIKTETMKQAPIRVKEEMTKVLLDAVNDASLLQR